MSFYSVGKNEIKTLIEKEKKLKKEIEKIESKKKCSNVCDFKSILLQKEMKKIHTKLEVLSMGNNSGGGDIA